VVKSCSYHIRSLHHLRLHIDRETAVNLACSIVTSKLDYCDSVLYGISGTNIAKLPRMQNNLAHVVCKSPYNTNVTELLRELHWLLVQQLVDWCFTARQHKIGQFVPIYQGGSLAQVFEDSNIE